MSDKEDKIIFFQPDQELGKSSFLVQEGISAGFPLLRMILRSCGSVLTVRWSKTRRLLHARVSGESMQGAGLDDGDLLVIDRSLEPQDNKIAVCFIDGEFTVKRLKVEEDCVYLMPENSKYEPIKVTEDNELIIWGVVTMWLKSLDYSLSKIPAMPCPPPTQAVTIPYF